MATRCDVIGIGYSDTRRADPRITERLLEMLALPVGSSILDVGAGTGNYSVALAEAGYRVMALEPSAVMRGQGQGNRLTNPARSWLDKFVGWKRATSSIGMKGPYRAPSHLAPDFVSPQSLVQTSSIGEPRQSPNATEAGPSRICETASGHPNLVWCAGVAEALPFENGAYDGVVMTLSMHHFTDWREALRECVRVTGGGPVVIFTFDFEFEAEFWLFDYFPSFRVKDAGQFPKMGEIEVMAASLGMGFAMERFPLPADLTDHFAASGWRRPEIYLEESYRAGISSFASADEDLVAEGVRKLAGDLASGEWEERYGELREREVLDVGYLFLRVGGSQRKGDGELTSDFN